MAGVAAATAAGAALLLYYTGRSTQVPWPLRLIRGGQNAHGIQSEEEANPRSPSGNFRAKPWRPPSAWAEAMSTLGETLRFTYSETLGKWPLVDLAFGINWLTRTKGHSDVAAVYGGPNSTQLKGAPAIAQVQELLRLLNICILFKRPFPFFLESTGFKEDQILLREGTAGLLKPAFVVIRDDANKTVLLIIRGTYSMKDTLTAVTGTIVPYHHIVTQTPGDGQGDVVVEKVVTGHAHCGMVASARWIGQRASSVMEQALKANPGYRLKIVGHSLGGGTASLLAYNLREKACFAGTEVVAFAPAACMTWDLSESGQSFVTSVINGFDLVPTFSCASVDDLRGDVTASAWWPEFRDQMEEIRVLRLLMGGASFMGRGLTQLGQVPAVIGNSAGVIWKPVSSGARNAAAAVASVRPKLTWTNLACGGVLRRRVNTPDPIPEEGLRGANAPPQMEMDRGSAGEERQGELPERSGEDLGFLLRSFSRSQSLSNLTEAGTSSGVTTPRHSRSRSSSRIDLTRQEEVTGLAAILNNVGRQSARDRDLIDSDDDIDDNEEVSTRSDASGLERMQAELEALQKELDGKEEGEPAISPLETGPLEEEATVKKKMGSVEWLQEKTRFFPPGRVMHIVRSLASAREEPTDHGFGAEGSGDVNIEKSPGVKGPPQFSFAGELMRAWRPQPLVDARPGKNGPENPEGVPSLLGNMSIEVGGKEEAPVEPGGEALPLSSGFGSPIELEDGSKSNVQELPSPSSPLSKMTRIEGEATTSSGGSIADEQAEQSPSHLRRRERRGDERQTSQSPMAKESQDEINETREELQSGPQSQSAQDEEYVHRLVYTDKKLYGKIWLSRSMVMDHYMPQYRRCLQEVLLSLEQDEHGS